MATRKTSRLKVGTQVQIQDIARLIMRCRGRDGRFTGTGGVVFGNPEVIYRPATVAMLGERSARVCISWGMDDENRDLAVWVDAGDVAPVAV